MTRAKFGPDLLKTVAVYKEQTDRHTHTHTYRLQIQFYTYKTDAHNGQRKLNLICKKNKAKGVGRTADGKR